MRVHIKYNDKQGMNQTFNDLKIYVSLERKEPDERDCYRSYINVRNNYLTILAWSIRSFRRLEQKVWEGFCLHEFLVYSWTLYNRHCQICWAAET